MIIIRKNIEINMIIIVIKKNMRLFKKKLQDNYFLILYIEGKIKLTPEGDSLVMICIYHIF